MKAFPALTVKTHGAVSLLVGLILFAGLADRLGYLKAFLTATAFTIASFGILIQKYVNRVRVLRLPFPEEWRCVLESGVEFYRKLSDEGRKRFEDDIRIFLSEQRIFGAANAPVADEVKLMIAASAAMLGFGLPDWEWPNLRDILVYPSGFDENYDIRSSHPIRGMVHHQGPIIFSETDLKMGFLKRQPEYHVGLHEMAHVLDMADGSANGVPVGMNWMVSAPWIRVMADRIQKVRKGRCEKILREYAGVDEAEFFAVAVEVFFQRPDELKQSDPELFALLKSYFNLDPSMPG